MDVLCAVSISWEHFVEIWWMLTDLGSLHILEFIPLWEEREVTRGLLKYILPKHFRRSSFGNSLASGKVKILRNKDTSSGGVDKAC
jgi:hypothetical protein